SLNDLEDALVVSPDIGRATEARRLANYLNLPLAMLYKRRRSPTDTEVTHVIGEVEGKRPIIIDDMISTAGTMRRGIEALLKLGAQEDVRVTATHAVFTRPAMGRLRSANYLNLPLAMLYKRRRSPTDTEVTHVIGEVEGKRPIIIDDMISTAGTMRRGIEALLKLGAQEDVRVTATHAVFTPPAMERL